MAGEGEPQAKVLRGSFYAGRIVKLRLGARSGVVEAAGSGRRIPFEWPLVRLIGAEKFDDLRVGMEVGFDVSWTSRGLRVSAIKVFSEPQPERPGVDPEGELNLGSSGHEGPESGEPPRNPQSDARE
ncbi:hypothetical protein HRbin30_01136 [bacterium HR30]|nr:hypothetical protein HRbin30_01136 [bacterium HR30]